MPLSCIIYYLIYCSKIALFAPSRILMIYSPLDYTKGIDKQHKATNSQSITYLCLLSDLWEYDYNKHSHVLGWRSTMNCAVELFQWSLSEVLTNLNGHLIYLSVNNRSSLILRIIHPQRIIADNKLACDFIDTVLLLIYVDYSYVIELVSIAVWWLLAPPTNWCQ